MSEAHTLLLSVENSGAVGQRTARSCPRSPISPPAPRSALCVNSHHPSIPPTSPEATARTRASPPARHLGRGYRGRCALVWRLMKRALRAAGFATRAARGDSLVNNGARSSVALLRPGIGARNPNEVVDKQQQDAGAATRGGSFAVSLSVAPLPLATTPAHNTPSLPSLAAPTCQHLHLLQKAPNLIVRSDCLATGQHPPQAPPPRSASHAMSATLTNDLLDRASGALFSLDGDLTGPQIDALEREAAKANAARKLRIAIVTENFLPVSRERVARSRSAGARVGRWDPHVRWRRFTWSAGGRRVANDPLSALARGS